MLEHVIGKDVGKVVVDVQGIAEVCIADQDGGIAEIAIVQRVCGLLRGQRIAFLLEFGGGFRVIVQGGGHLLVVHPLVADEFQLLAAIGVLQIVVGRRNETVGQLVLLLERGVGQRSVDGVLGQVGTVLSAQGGVDVVSGFSERGADVVDRRTDIVHVLEDGVEFADAAGCLVGKIHKGVELFGAGLHDYITGHDTIFICFVIEEEFLHVADTFNGSLAREAGGFADVAAGLVAVDIPVHEGGEDKTEGANDDYGSENEDTFLFHNTCYFNC